VLESSVDDVARSRTAAKPPEAVTLEEPGREIWFKHRVSVRRAFAEFWEFRPLIRALAERDIRVRYKQAVLGLAWAVLTPVVMMLAFTLVFTKVGHVATGGIPYPLFSYIALIPWGFFSASVLSGGMSLMSNLALLNKLYCPREVFPIAAMIDAAVDAVIAAFVLVLLFPITGFAPKLEGLYAPLLLIPLLAFTLGTMLVISAVIVYMRDLRLVLPLVIQVGLFVTPVIYSPVIKTKAVLLAYSFLNPLVPVLEGLRRTVLLGHAPDWTSLGVGTLSSLLVLFVGFILFKRLETGIADVA